MVLNYLRRTEGGVVLPSLNNPATANRVASGYDFINKDGERIVGTVPTLRATTYTPTTSSQTISSGRILTGVQTINGDTDLIPSNIRNGVTIFGVTGTYEAQSNQSDFNYASRSTSTTLSINLGFLPAYVSMINNGAGNGETDAMGITLSITGMTYWITGWNGVNTVGTTQGFLSNSASPMSSYSASYTYSGGVFTIYLRDWTFGAVAYSCIAFTF